MKQQPLCPPMVPAGSCFAVAAFVLMRRGAPTAHTFAREVPGGPTNIIQVGMRRGSAEYTPLARGVDIHTVGKSNRGGGTYLNVTVR